MHIGHKDRPRDSAIRPLLPTRGRFAHSRLNGCAHRKAQRVTRFLLRSTTRPQTNKEPTNTTHRLSCTIGKRRSPYSSLYLILVYTESQRPSSTLRGHAAGRLTQSIASEAAPAIIYKKTSGMAGAMPTKTGHRLQQSASPVNSTVFATLQLYLLMPYEGSRESTLSQGERAETSRGDSWRPRLTRMKGSCQQQRRRSG